MNPQKEKKSAADASGGRNPPLHGGHRDRLRQRFMKSDGQGIADYELLEMLLFAAIPRRDVKPLAKSLLARFKTLSGIVGAGAADLQQVRGLSENSAILMKVVHAICKTMLRENIREKPLLASWRQLIDYCHVSMAQEKREHLRVLFLNRKNQMIADEVQQVGTVDHAPVYPREIVRRALELGATAIILVHNHPSGDPAPSDSDIEMTDEVIRAASALGLLVHDHIIISESGHVSLKSLGLLEFTG